MACAGTERAPGILTEAVYCIPEERDQIFTHEWNFYPWCSSGLMCLGCFVCDHGLSITDALT